MNTLNTSKKQQQNQHIFSHINGLKSVWDFLQEIESDPQQYANDIKINNQEFHLKSQPKQAKLEQWTIIRFLFFKFLPHLIIILFSITILSILEYVGPISLDLLTQRFYQMNSPKVRGTPSDFLQDLFDSFILFPFQQIIESKNKKGDLHLQYKYDSTNSQNNNTTNNIHHQFMDQVNNENDSQTVIAIIILSIMIILANVVRDFVRIQVDRMSLSLRTGMNIFLQNVIYEKSMRLYTNIASVRGVVHEQKVLTFHNMLGVIERLNAAIEEFLYIVRVSIELTIGFYYLYSMVEKVAVYSFSSAVLVSILAIACAGVIQIFVFRLRSFSDQRLKLCEDVLNGFKQIKYLGWEKFFQGKLQDIRDREFDQVKGIEYGDSFINFFRRITQSVLLFVTLSNITDITTVNIFTTLVLFDKFVSPLNGLPWALGTLAGSIFQLKRIKDYMDQMEINESLNPTKQSKARHSEELIDETDTHLSKSSHSVSDSKSVRNQKINSRIAVECRTKGVFWPHQNYFFRFKIFKKYLKVKETEKVVIFKNLNVKIKESTLTILIGKVGAGKTAFFDLLLNELDAPDSQVAISGQIAYVAQNNWLCNDSVQANILFGNSYDETLYKKCVTLAQLDQDISTFKEHDQYIVGFNGGNLSGGQKTRVCICRALYSSADIFLFDDIFSSIDENVASLIFTHAIKAYLIDQLGKTVIISLNQFQYLPLADTVLSIDEFTITDITSTISRNSSPQQIQKQIQEQIQQSFTNNDGNSCDETKSEEKDQGLDQTKHQKILKNSFQNWQFYISRMGVQVLVIFLLSTILHQACQGILEYWSHRFIQSIGGNTKPLFLFGSFQKTLGILFLGLSFFNIVRSAMYAYAELTSSKAIFQDVLRSTMYASMGFLDSKPTPIGFIVDRLFRDMSFLDCLPINYFFIVFFNAVQIGFILLSEFNSMAPVIILSILLLRKIIKYEKRLEERLLNMVKNITKIPTNDRTSFIVETFKNDLTLLSAKIGKSRELPYYLSKLVDYLAIAIVCGRAIYDIINNRDQFNPAPVCMALAYSYRMIGSIESSIRATDEIDKTERVICKVREFCEQPNEFDSDILIPSSSNSSPEPPKKQQNENMPISLSTKQTPSLERELKKGDPLIEFENVSLHYLENPKPALNNLSFSIQKGSKVAFCGRTGSGKTSIINCIARLYDISSGKISLNGKSISDMSIANVRNQFSVIPQNGFLFNGTLRENIDPLERFSTAEVDSFIRSTNLRFDRFETPSSQNQNTGFVPSNSSIKQNEQQPTFLDFTIEKAGKNLSNGEKQIVNFLQSIIQQKDIIILDEATSNMDPETDASIIRLLLSEIAKDKTLILISHRLGNLVDFDTIFVLEDGKIIESGTYKELSNNPQSHFASVLKYKS